MISEMIAVVGMANETNRLVEGYQVEVDEIYKSVSYTHLRAHET